MELALGIQLFVWLAVLGAFLASRQASLYHPATLYIVFHGLVFVVRPILVCLLGFNSVWTYIGVQPAEEDLIRTLMVTSVALVIFVSSCLWAGWSRVQFQHQPPPVFSAPQRRTLLLTTILFLPLTAISIYATRNGIAGDRVAGVYIMTNSTGYLNDAQFVIAPLLVAWAMATRFHWLNLVPSIVYIGYRVWFGWARWTIVLFFLTLVIAYCWHKRRKWIPATALVLAIPIVAIFNLLGHNRDYLKNSLMDGSSSWKSDVEAGMSSFEKFRRQTDTQDFANFDYLAFILSIVPKRTESFTYGAQYLQIFTEPIPRILWKGKPVGAPVRTIDISPFGNFVGLTFSLPGDGWCNGGWIGLVITMGMVGGILGRLHRWYWRHVASPMAAIFYLTALPLFVQWYRDGGISIAKFLFWTWLPLLLWRGLAWLKDGPIVRGNFTTLRPGDHLRLVHPGRGD